MTSDQAFQYAYDHTVAIEGGYVNDPADAGGETFMGISRRAHPGWAGWILIDGHFKSGGKVEGLEDIDQLTELVQSVYKVEYWNALQLPEIAKNISYLVAVELFDSAVNCGTSRVGKWLQHAINLVGRSNAAVFEDGIVGPKTLTRLAIVVKEFERGFIKTLNGLQFEHYHNIVLRNPTQRRFIRGWLRRVWEDR